MQIDGHHALSYTVSRMAGFEHKEAETIAYAAQYVDDATNSGLIKFKDGSMYSRISSAHGVLDIGNHLDEHENHLVWVPFHFLPGNGGEDENGGTELSFVEKIKCTKDSYIAAEMIDCSDRTCTNTIFFLISTEDIKSSFEILLIIGGSSSSIFIFIKLL